MLKDGACTVIRVRHAPEMFLVLVPASQKANAGDLWSSSRELDEHELRHELLNMGLAVAQIDSLIHRARK